MNANLQMLLHAPPVQAVLCSMPVPPPPSDGPPTPRAEEPARTLGNLCLVPSNESEGKADPAAAGSIGSAQAVPSVEDGAETADGAVALRSSNVLTAGVPEAGQGSPAEAAEGALCGFSPERAALPSIEEHPEAAQVLSAAQPAQAQAPAPPEAARLPAGMTVKTCVAEEAPDAGDADADSSRSQTPVYIMGVATPDIAHPPSAAEALQRGHQPWASTEAPASLLQTGVSASGSKDSSAPAATLSPEEPTAAEDRHGNTASVQGALPGSEKNPAGTEPEEPVEAATAGGDPRPNAALPPPEAMTTLKPGELFCAFRRFAHEVGPAVPALICILLPQRVRTLMSSATALLLRPKQAVPAEGMLLSCAEYCRRVCLQTM